VERSPAACGDALGTARVARDERSNADAHASRALTATSDVKSDRPSEVPFVQDGAGLPDDDRMRSR
jgi:hypothetical protein